MMLVSLLPFVLFAFVANAEPRMAGDAKPPAADAGQPATLVGHEPQRPAEQVRAAIRAEAQRLYGEECGTVTLPDRAIVPVEFTGGGHPEYAVIFGRGSCDGDGSSGRWMGTGGSLVQFWLASGGPPRMLLEHQMHGFTLTADGLLSDQHAGFCPGGAGPNTCLVRYRWNDRDRTLEVAERRYLDGSTPEQPPRMEWGYEQLSR